jgi:hypothetical protein
MGEESDREMLIRALRYFSDNCVPGDLHPECPYSVLTRSGLGCAEECLDYLAVHEPPKEASVEFIAGIGAVPMRHRRYRQGPAAGSPPFDSGQIYLEQSVLPVDRRSPVALMRGLVELLTEAPLESPEELAKRRGEFFSIEAQLVVQGFDVDNIVRETIIGQIATLICGSVLALVFVDELPDGAFSGSFRSWLSILIPSCQSLDEVKKFYSDPVAGQDLVTKLLGEDQWRIRQWLSSLSREDLVAWRVPEPEEYGSLTIEPAAVHDPKSLWAYDRFTETYLSNWKTVSLHYEWEYLTGKRPPVCLPRYMSFRKLDRADVATAIADREVDQRKGSDSFVVSKYSGRAIELLERGDRSAAVTLFDIACDLSPESANAHNNRGFCRLIDDPALALNDFEIARNLGTVDPFLPAANQMLALHRLQRNASAMKIAEDAWGWDWARADRAVMWDFRTDEAVLTRTDSLLYLAELAAEIARTSGDAVAEAKWRSRASQRRDDTAAAERSSMGLD